MKKSIKQMVGKRIVSVILSALLAVTGVGLLPQFAMPVKAVNTPYNINLASVQETFSDNCTIQITGDGTVTDHTIDITVAANKTVTVELSGVNIDVSITNNACAFKISGGGNVVINLTGTNILKSGYECAGLQNSNSGSLTINGTIGTGSLNATGGQYAAGIGSGYQGNSGTITINGGEVSGTGGESGAGIGSGFHGTSGDITISGGEVRGTGGQKGAGIGGGYCGTSGDITISGGEVSGTGGKDGAGIGNTYYGPCGDVSISGGTVFASGGEAGAGIGGGYFIDSPNIDISGDPQIHVSGGPSSRYGDGAGIGEGGRNASGTAGSEGGDFTGLWTTGSVYYYPKGTAVSAIKSGTVQSASITVGLVDPLAVPASAPLPVDCMQEVMDDINTAIALGGEQTVTIKGYSALSSDVMELLAEHPQITVVSEFSFDGLDYKITIPGSAVKLNPAIEWYGPKYLFPMFCMYGTDTAPAMQAFLEKYAEEIK